MGAKFWSDGGKDLGLVTGQVFPALLDSICLHFQPGGAFSGSGFRIRFGNKQMTEVGGVHLHQRGPCPGEML